ncbi:MAG: hypothetical protein M1812_007434 [Candelaria pacifica]|nr:MAG: hypothetical protein M1812_007434 [Candelaria pacifica]
MFSLPSPSTSAVEGPRSRAIFPFLELPPELRNKIYGHLLISPLIDEGIGMFLDQGNGVYRWGTYTAILSTNRQIFFESSSIFYSENLFTVHGYDDSLWFADQDLPSRTRKNYPATAHSLESIRKIRRWKFVIQLEPRPRPANENNSMPPFHRLKRDISHMCERLAQCYCLKEIIIEFWRGQGESRLPAFATGSGVLEPFTTVRGVQQVTIRGDLPEEYKNFLKQLMRGPRVPLPSQFVFLNLPIHLRKKIYRLLLLEDSFIEPFERNYEASVRRLSPNILATSRQISNEAATVFFRENRILFRINEWATFRHDLMEVCIGSSLRHFKSFCVQVGAGGHRSVVASAVNLACRILTSVRRLEHLVIKKVIIRRGIRLYSDDQVLAPLQRLCNVGHVSVEGYISPDFKAYLAFKLPGPHPGHVCRSSPHDAYPHWPWRFSDLLPPTEIFFDVNYGLPPPPSPFCAFRAPVRVFNTEERCRRCNGLGYTMDAGSLVYLTKFLKRGEL